MLMHNDDDDDDANTGTFKAITGFKVVDNWTEGVYDVSCTMTLDVKISCRFDGAILPWDVF